MKELKTIIVILIMALCSVGFLYCVAEAEEYKRDDSMAYIMMESWVEDRLKNPRGAKFAYRGHAKHVVYSEGNYYIIQSYVDAQNSFGGTIRTPFIGMVQQVSKDSWILINLEFK